jgi:hypothetical protein
MQNVFLCNTNASFCQVLCSANPSIIPSNGLLVKVLAKMPTMWLNAARNIETTMVIPLSGAENDDIIYSD